MQHLEWPFFDAQHRELAARITAWCRTHAQTLETHGTDIEHDTRAAAATLGAAGWLNYLAPAAQGGALAAIDVRSLCLVREALAFHSGVADCAFAIQGLGSVPVTLFGTDVQRARFVPGVLAGTQLGAFALSEPDSGSDVAGMRTTARRDGAHYVLNGAKAWISNAGIADHYIVFAQTGDTGNAKTIAAFVVDAAARGLAVTDKPAIIAPHAIGTVTFTDCRIDAGALIGSGSDGFKIAMATLDIFRATVGAAALGFARRALHETLARIDERQIFGQKLAEFQATRLRVADMAVDVDAAALLVYRAAWTKDTQTRRVTRESSMAKDRKSTRLNSSHVSESRMPSSA